MDSGSKSLVDGDDRRKKSAGKTAGYIDPEMEEEQPAIGCPKPCEGLGVSLALWKLGIYAYTRNYLAHSNQASRI